MFPMSHIYEPYVIYGVSDLISTLQWNVSNITYMSSMFYGDTNLTSMHLFDAGWVDPWVFPLSTLGAVEKHNVPHSVNTRKIKN